MLIGIILVSLFSTVVPPSRCLLESNLETNDIYLILG